MYRLVKIIDTTLRDAHQSLIATRLSQDDARDIAEIIDRAGFYSLEVWGGATFDVDVRYLKEDPWSRLKKIREVVKKTKLQMLLRGRNLVGYRKYPIDVSKAFIEKAYENGIDIFRIFDALNDIDNIAEVIKIAKRTGAIVQGALSYTISPIHTVDYYVKLAESYLEAGADLITIKDMAGLLDPSTARSLISRIKKELKVKVNIHTHDSCGLSVATYLASIEAGADFIDTSIYPLAFGTAQPAIQTVYNILLKKDRKKLKMSEIEKASRHIDSLLKKKYSQLYNPKLQVPDPRAMIHQIPGGMLSNMIAQLNELQALDRLEEVLMEIPKIRKELGWPPLVTPMSQIVGAQAVLNVISGERYSIVVKELVDYVKGLYGKPPAPIDKNVAEIILAGDGGLPEKSLSLIECREYMKKLLNDPREEDVITFCLFPKEAEAFFKEKFVSVSPISQLSAQKQLEKQ
ncbi:MAG: pyruvate carboxylase subunit B [Fervidicoccus sp.]